MACGGRCPYLWSPPTANPDALIGSSVLLLDADGRRCRTSANVLGVTSSVACQLSHVLGLLTVSRSGDQRLGDSQDNGRVEQPCRRVEHPRDAKNCWATAGSVSVAVKTRSI